MKKILFLFSILLIISCESTPTEVNDSGYSSEEVKFTSGDLELEGTLYLPNKTSKVPGAIFVNGSGPVDRDGKVSNYPDIIPPIYKNWANELSSNQIATFRYDKRFLTYPGIDPIKLSQEDQINDIIAAISYLKSRPEVDTNNIFIVGHSEGGTIAPVAAQRISSVAGVIIIASPAFAIDTLFIEQLKANDSIEQDWVTQTEDAFQLLRNNQFPKGGQIWGVGETYWREWIEYSQNAGNIALNLGKPILIQQGLEDENYPSFTLQKSILLWDDVAKQSNIIDFKTYENVTHLILEKDSQEMSRSVINDIIDWITTH